MLVNKPVISNFKVIQICLIGLSILLFGQSPVRAEFYSPNSLNLTGSLGYTYGYTKTNNLESEVNALRVNVSGSSIIWQPWFANMSAGIGLGLATSQSSSNNAAESDFTSNNIDLAFAVFPLSRFPFQLTYSLARNESDSVSNSLNGLASNTLITTTTRFGVSQAYTSYNRTHVNFFYNRNDFESDFSNFASSIAGLRINRSWAKQRYSIDTNFIDTKQKDTGISSSSLSFTATHGYLPSTEMGISSLISTSTSESGQSSESTVSQLSTNASWRPDHKPYSVSGGIRFSQTKTDTVLDTTESNSVGLGLSLAYTFSRQVRGNLIVNANSSESAGRQSINSSEVATVSFFAAPINFWSSNYNWNLSTSISNSNNQLDGNSSASPPVEETKTNSQSASAALSQALSRTWVYASGNLNLGGSSSFGVSKSFLDKGDAASSAPASGSASGTISEENDVTKSHSLSFNAAASHIGLGGNTIFNFNASDIRTLGDEGVVFQLATVSLSRSQGINRLSSANGNFNYQISKTDDPNANALDPDAGDPKESASAGVSYRHNRFLGVYSLTYAMSLKQESLLAKGDTKKGNITWQNSLSYAIGLISAKLNFRVIESPDGQRTLGANFSATRSF